VITDGAGGLVLRSPGCQPRANYSANSRSGSGDQVLTERLPTLASRRTRARRADGGHKRGARCRSGCEGCLSAVRHEDQETYLAAPDTNPSRGPIREAQPPRARAASPPLPLRTARYCSTRPRTLETPWGTTERKVRPPNAGQRPRCRLTASGAPSAPTTPTICPNERSTRQLSAARSRCASEHSGECCMKPPRAHRRSSRSTSSSSTSPTGERPSAPKAGRPNGCTGAATPVARDWRVARRLLPAGETLACAVSRDLGRFEGAARSVRRGHAIGSPCGRGR
jgi:hypothetical protein